MGISDTLGENFMKYMSDQGEQDTNSVRGVLEEFTNVYVLTDISAYNDKDMDDLIREYENFGNERFGLLQSSSDNSSGPVSLPPPPPN